MTEDIQLRLVRALPFEGNTAWNYRGICDVRHTIYYILAGDGHIRTEKGALDLEPGRVYLIPRGLPHDLWCDTHIRKTYMDFHVELFPGCDALAEAGEVRSLPAGREVFCAPHRRKGASVRTKRRLFVMKNPAFVEFISANGNLYLFLYTLQIKESILCE